MRLIGDLGVTINMDFGEQIAFLNESSVIGKVDLCNIACGYHAGDGFTIFNSIDFCLKNKIKIGAHPSFPDRNHFGRKEMSLQYEELFYHLIFQLGAFLNIASCLGLVTHHVKAHGALYNKAAVSELEAKAIIDSTIRIFPGAAIVAMPGSVLADMLLSRDLPLIKEGFADRLYKGSNQLVPRSETGALITDVQKVKDQIDHIKRGFVINSLEEKISIQVDTICIHGDNPIINAILESL